MNDNKTIIDADKAEDAMGETPEFLAEDEAKETQPKKKSRLKFHVIMMLVLGVGTWAFITYSPIVKQWQADWYDFTHQSRGDEVATPVAQPYIAPQPAYEEPEPIAVDETPIFEDAPELVQVDPPAEIDAESLAGLIDMLASLQDQLSAMQDNMGQMYAQQMQQSKQQVSAQLSTLLHKASSPNSNLEESATAWKSISLLPMLDEDRRLQAEQAWAELQGLAQDSQTMRDEVITHIQTLAEKLRPEALAEVVESVDVLTDAYANTDTFQTWMDWLKEQYKVSKVRQHAVQLSEDPFAKLKDLINALDKLQQSLMQGAATVDIDTLVYQLEQYGISTSLSDDVIANMQQTQQAWREQAQAWMEQL